jgi:hypothetical protein
MLPGLNNVVGTGRERAPWTRRILAIVPLLRQIVPLIFLRNRAFAYNFFGSMPHFRIADGKEWPRFLGFTAFDIPKAFGYTQ